MHQSLIPEFVLFTESISSHSWGRKLRFPNGKIRAGVKSEQGQEARSRSHLDLEKKAAVGGDAPCRESILAVALVSRDVEVPDLALPAPRNQTHMMVHLSTRVGFGANDHGRVRIGQRASNSKRNALCRAPVLRPPSSKSRRGVFQVCDGGLREPCRGSPGPTR